MNSDRIVRERERREISGVPRTTWYRLAKTDKHIPKPVKPLGPESPAVGWLLSDLQKWIASRQRVKS